jgi:LysM repeat protein
MVPQTVDKIKHLFEFVLHLSVAGSIFLLSNKCSKTFPKVVNGRSKTMSTMTINSMNTSKVVDFQGFQANPSGRITLNRRGKLARTLVVLSLAIVAASVAGGQAGADTSKSTVAAADSFITVTVAPGDTVWSLASRVAPQGQAGALVSAIIEINSLGSGDVIAGQKIRIPL